MACTHARHHGIYPPTRVAEHLTRAAKDLDWPLAALGATAATAIVSYTRGDHELADRSARVVLAAMPADFRLRNFRDVLTFVRTAMAQNLCYLDRRAEAESVSRDAIERADWLADPYEMAHTRMSAAYCATLFADVEATRHQATGAAAISRRYGIDAIALITEILAAWADSDGDLAAAAASLGAARAFCETTGSHCHLPEIYRRTAWVEEQLGGGSADRSLRPRAWRDEAARIARRQGCSLVLRRLAARGGGSGG